MLFTFKYIDIPNYQDLLDEVRSNLDMAYLREVNFSFIQINSKELIPKCKLLNDFLVQNNLNAIKTVVVRGIPQWHKWNIHVDNCNAKTHEQFKLNYIHDFTSPTRDLLGLQLGLENVEETYTAMYKYISGEIIKTNDLKGTNKPADSGYPAWRFEKCQMEEIDRYVATRPVIFNATVPHSVVNNTSKPRLLLSVRFNPDPWHLTK